MRFIFCSMYLLYTLTIVYCVREQLRCDSANNQNIKHQEQIDIYICLCYNVTLSDIVSTFCQIRNVSTGIIIITTLAKLHGYNIYGEKIFK